MAIYGVDANGHETLLSKNHTPIMMEWEREYINAAVDTICPQGHVLEVGFGLGYSAQRIIKCKPLSYTLIECEPLVIERAKVWAKEQKGVTIQIAEGRWQTTLHTLGTFDQVYFDDHPLDGQVTSLGDCDLDPVKRLHHFLDSCIQRHTNIGARITWYHAGSLREAQLTAIRRPIIHISFKTLVVCVPDGCPYRKAGEEVCVIPLLVKLV